MSPAQAKDLVRRHLDELVNRKNLEVVLETLAEGFVDHDGLGGSNREGVRRAMRALQERLPSLRVSIEDLIAEGDRVVSRHTWSFTGPDGKGHEQPGLAIWRVGSGRLVERWGDGLLDGAGRPPEFGDLARPVTTIMGYAELLWRKLEDSPHRRYADELRKAAEELNALTRWQG